MLFPIQIQFATGGVSSAIGNESHVTHVTSCLTGSDERVYIAWT